MGGKCYLAGPISNLSYKRARLGWREKFTKLVPPEIECFSPMRGDLMLKGCRKIAADGSDYPAGHPIGTPSGVTTRDVNDVKNCDVMVACFLEAARGKPSLGTAIELGLAHAWQKPIVGIGPAKDVHLSHIMSAHLIHYSVRTLEEAAEIVQHLILPGI